MPSQAFSAVPATRFPRLPQSWVVLTRPNHLPTALAVAEALADDYPGGCHLLLENSSWWRQARWEEYRERFAAVHPFARVPECRGLFGGRRFYRQVVERQRALGALPFAPEHDALVCLSGVTTLANAATSAFRGGRRVLCVPRPVHETLLRPPDRWRYRSTTAGWIQSRFVEPLAGLERTLHLKPRLNRGGDGVRQLRLVRPVEAIYDAVIPLSNTGRERPAGAGRGTFPARFPSGHDLPTPKAGREPGADSARRTVVFFGTPFLLVRNLSPDAYVRRLDECLDYLRRSYPRAAWVYRPHPAETGEAALLRLEGFTVETDGEVAELYFLRQFARIEAVYSVSSTVSRVALNFGLNAHCLWRCFPFAETQRRFFAQVMGEVPPGFEVRDLASPPQPRCEAEAGAGPSLGEALRAALATTAIGAGRAQKWAKTAG